MLLQGLRNISRQIADHLLPSSCILCGSTNCHNNLCNYCQTDLPINHHACLRCALPLPNSAASNSLCGHCQHQPPAFDWIQAPLLYQQPVDQLINRFKHQGHLACGALLVKLLAGQLKTYLNENPAAKPDVIVPVPLHWQRQFQRGFNQAGWVAMQLSRQLGTPLDYTLITRAVATSPQQGLTRKQRLRNLQQSFEVKKDITNLRIAVVDDVATTGSTLDTIARALKRSGAAVVYGYCLARTPLENRCN